MRRALSRGRKPPHPPLPSLRPPWCCCFWLDTLRMKKMGKKTSDSHRPTRIPGVQRRCVQMSRLSFQTHPGGLKAATPEKVFTVELSSHSLSLILKSFWKKTKNLPVLTTTISLKFLTPLKSLLQGSYALIHNCCQSVSLREGTAETVLMQYEACACRRRSALTPEERCT